MILQNCILPKRKEYKELYYRSSSQVFQKQNYLFIPKGEVVSTDTYMNSFDIETWRKYTDVSQLHFSMHCEGNAKINLVCKQKDGNKKSVEILKEGDFSFEVKIPEEFQKGIIYLEILAQEDTKIYSANFESKMEIKQDCKIALIICTYKRKGCLENIIKILNDENEKNSFHSWLNITIVDNASELKNNYGENIHIYHNPNTGGSGGFSRGMDEVVNNLNRFSATHIVLMDDDVKFCYESLVRLRSLLSYMKKEYLDESVAGRMFRLDKPMIQYTAAEIWNGGNLKHIGWNQDMTLRDSLWSMNDNTGGEYSGWWFACYPIEFVKKNRPLPFFIHCDDVEYGLRHGGTPIILNGIQVWHETAEYRQSAIMEYYDIRNMLFVNEIRNISQDSKEIYRIWKQKMGYARSLGRWTNEYLIIIGFNHYLNGLEKILHYDVEKIHNHLRKLKGKRYKNAFAWRIVAIRYFFIKHKLKRRRCI